jgi:hypothetical protein
MSAPYFSTISSGAIAVAERSSTSRRPSPVEDEAVGQHAR